MFINFPFHLIPKPQPANPGPLSVLPDLLERAAMAALAESEGASRRRAEALAGTVPLELAPLPIAPSRGEALALIVGELLGRAIDPSGLQSGGLVRPFLEGRSIRASEDFAAARAKETARQAQARTNALQHELESERQFERFQVHSRQAEALRRRQDTLRTQDVTRRRQLELETLRQRGRLTSEQHRAILNRLQDVPGGLAEYIRSQSELNEGQMPESLVRALTELTPSESRALAGTKGGDLRAAPQAGAVNLAVPSIGNPPNLGTNLAYASVLVRRLDPKSRNQAADAYSRMAARILKEEDSQRNIPDLKFLVGTYDRRIAALEAAWQNKTLKDLTDLDIGELKAERRRLASLLDALSGRAASGLAPLSPSVPPHLTGPIGPIPR
jgi:hypothetical protein